MGQKICDELVLVKLLQLLHMLLQRLRLLQVIQLLQLLLDALALLLHTSSPSRCPTSSRNSRCLPWI